MNKEKPNLTQYFYLLETSLSVCDDCPEICRQHPSRPGAHPAPGLPRLCQFADYLLTTLAISLDPLQWSE